MKKKILLLTTLFVLILCSMCSAEDKRWVCSTDTTSYYVDLDIVDFCQNGQYVFVVYEYTPTTDVLLVEKICTVPSTQIYRVVAGNKVNHDKSVEYISMGPVLSYVDGSPEDQMTKFIIKNAKRY